MDEIKTTTVNGQTRYSVELSPGLRVEASTLAEILRFIMEYKDA